MPDIFDGFLETISVLNWIVPPGRYTLRLVPISTNLSKVCHRKMVILHFHTTKYGQHDHYSDVIMGVMASQISLTIVYSTVYSGADQRKHQSSASLYFVRGIHRGPVNSPHKWLVTRKMLPFDDVIMKLDYSFYWLHFSYNGLAPVFTASFPRNTDVNG